MKRSTGRSQFRISGGDGEHALAEDGLFATRLQVDGEEYAILSAPLPEPRDTGVRLTDAERDVVRLVLEGRSNASIAAVRATSARTVANQLASIYQKLRVGSRSELVSSCGSGRRHGAP